MKLHVESFDFTITYVTSMEAPSALAEAIRAQVIGVLDGDTIEVLSD
jgi:hypothetical protein